MRSQPRHKLPKRGGDSKNTEPKVCVPEFHSPFPRPPNDFALLLPGGWRRGIDSIYDQISLEGFRHRVASVSANAPRPPRQNKTHVSFAACGKRNLSDSSWMSCTRFGGHLI